MRLKDKIAVVTGSSLGIGEAIAIRFAEEGADVVVNYRSHPEEGEKVADKIKAMGRRSIAVRADLGSMADVTALMEKSISEMGRVDVLCNNAGIEIHDNFWDVKEADYDKVLNVNLKGVFFMTQAFVKHLMADKRPGVIINMSSTHEELPFPHFTSYCASKGGLKMMTRNCAIELAPYNIRINSIAPGAIETPINKKLLNDPAKLASLLANIPLNRLGQPSDIASAAVYLASEEASYVTGTTLFVDGGLLWNYSEQ
jgi:glucose 1-dehydrogenase